MFTHRDLEIDDEEEWQDIEDGGLLEVEEYEGQDVKKEELRKLEEERLHKVETRMFAGETELAKRTLVVRKCKDRSG